MPLSFFALILAAFCVSAVLTHFLRKRLIAKAVMDIPNERSMHKVPVPRGGGLAVMAVILAGMAYYMPNPFLLTAIILLMLISWLDDKKGMRASVRLLAHLTAAFVGSFALGDSAVLMDGLLPFWLDRLILVVCWAWIMNLYNFMDGIDGITATQTISNALGFGLLISLLHLPFMHGAEIAAVIMGACGGFLILNWHPAKIFMGDVGSIPLGFLIGFFMFKLALAGYPLPALLIPLYYLMDSGITITRRALKGEKIWHAHRSHFYQRATTGTGSPKPIVFSILITNLCLVTAAGVAVSTPWLGALLGAMVVTALLVRMSFASK